MSDILDDRRKALEEEYFQRKDKESLHKLREELRTQAKERGEEVSTMPCPRCTGALHEEVFDEVHIDRCNSCNGIWLDAGELEQIINQESTTGRWISAFWPGDTSERSTGG